MSFLADTVTGSDTSNEHHTLTIVLGRKDPLSKTNREVVDQFLAQLKVAITVQGPAHQVGRPACCHSAHSPWAWPGESNHCHPAEIATRLKDTTQELQP